MFSLYTGSSGVTALVSRARSELAKGCLVPTSLTCAFRGVDSLTQLSGLVLLYLLFPLKSSKIKSLSFKEF